MFLKSILCEKNLCREESIIEKGRIILLGEGKIQLHRIDKIVVVAGEL